MTRGQRHSGEVNVLPQGQARAAGFGVAFKLVECFGQCFPKLEAVRGADVGADAGCKAVVFDGPRLPQHRCAGEKGVKLREVRASLPHPQGFSERAFAPYLTGGEDGRRGVLAQVLAKLDGGDEAAGATSAGVAKPPLCLVGIVEQREHRKVRQLHAGCLALAGGVIIGERVCFPIGVEGCLDFGFGVAHNAFRKVFVGSIHCKSTFAVQW